MRRLDAATKWSVSFALIFGVLPWVVGSLPWAVWVKDEKLAAWVQAVGSIAAVLATGGAILLQHALTMRHREADDAAMRRRRLEGARRLMAAAVNTMDKCPPLFAQATPAGLDQVRLLLRMRELVVVADTLRTINSVEMEDWSHTEAVATSITIVDSATAFLARQVHPVSATGFMERSELPNLFNEMRAHLAERECRLAGVLQHPSATA